MVEVKGNGGQNAINRVLILPDGTEFPVQVMIQYKADSPTVWFETSTIGQQVGNWKSTANRTLRAKSMDYLLRLVRENISYERQREWHEMCLVKVAYSGGNRARWKVLRAAIDHDEHKIAVATVNDSIADLKRRYTINKDWTTFLEMGLGGVPLWRTRIDHKVGFGFHDSRRVFIFRPLSDLAKWQEIERKARHITRQIAALMCLKEEGPILHLLDTARIETEEIAERDPGRSPARIILNASDNAIP